MGIRPKLISVFLVLGFLPMIVLSVLLYRGGVRSIESDVRQNVAREATGIAREIDSTLRENEMALSALAQSNALRSYIRSGNGFANHTDVYQAEDNRPDAQMDQPNAAIPADVRECVRAFILSKSNRYTVIYCIDPFGKPLFRARPVTRTVAAHGSTPESDVEFRTSNFLTGDIDSRVWITPEQLSLRAPISKEANDVALRYSTPVFAEEPGVSASRGVLIADLDCDVLFNDVTRGNTNDRRDSSSSAGLTSSLHVIMLLDGEGRLLYHPNDTLRYQNVDSVLPSLKNVASAMKAGKIGWDYYDAGGSRWLMAFRPSAISGVSIGVADNYTAATNSFRRLDWLILGLIGVFGLASVVVFSQILRSTSRSIERVTEGAVAIAGGRLEQRIEVLSNDETRLLAESFNKMTDRLREQISRETESRQFESFVRLSAMLTHDLKNSIAGLSLLVGNMERQFHREEFRADAMKSLTEATDKLRRLVAKLSEPVLSLSSEHRIARLTDLVVIIRNVITANVEPTRGLHKIEIKLPETLMATVEADRIEKVFENLIINAIEAMGAKSGELTIEAGVIEPGEVFFSVSDTGPGMSDEFQRVKLYRPFATTKPSGIGLGLYTCREIVLAHGGRIDIGSKRGHGATFRVVLPSELKITDRA